jgi:hypothetical protein
MVSVDAPVESQWLEVVMAMQRPESWTPTFVSNRGDRTDGETKVDQADDPTGGMSTLHVTYLYGSSEDVAKVLDRKNQRRADIRFAIGVALALALPAFIGLGIYIAAESIILRAT